VDALARHLCGRSRWRLVQTRFYTGDPDGADNAFWHGFWEGKLRTIGVSALSGFDVGDAGR
jgi:hypothetical protein